jgi:hypothetical protein
LKKGTDVKVTGWSDGTIRADVVERK